jgi:chemotaxis methyl-accepting protein methylase
MTMPAFEGAATPPALVQAMALLAASRTGFRLEAIALDVIQRTVRELLARGVSPAELLERVMARDPEIVPALERAVAVGETYFFRQPQHFELVAREVAARRPPAVVRAWSAGCATGEEAYSLAATLFDAAPSADASVLGTDLVAEHVATARSASYDRRSLRGRAPMYRLGPPSDGETVGIDERLRAVTRFEPHNLLEPLPEAYGRFDVVLCRNVLVYFTPAAQRAAVAHLTAALAEGGIVLFGPLDLVEPPAGLVPVGPPELQAWRRPWAPEPIAAARARTPGALPRLRRAGRGPHDTAVSLHVRALERLDAGELRGAAALLDELVRREPEYVPGLVERALVHMRHGERAPALRLMREVLHRTAELDLDATLPGPEPLPVRFYVAAAQVFLERHGGRA